MQVPRHDQHPCPFWIPKVCPEGFWTMTKRLKDWEMVLAGERLTRDGLAEYGHWIASLAPWSHFITLTHDPARLEKIRPTWTQVGPRAHRRRIRNFVLEVRRRFDKRLTWWSEMEILPTGAAHEHALVAWHDPAPLYTAMQVWFDRCGAWNVKPIEGGSESIAAYIGKYGGKSGAFPPFVIGLGLHDRESHSVAAMPIVQQR